MKLIILYIACCFYFASFAQTTNKVANQSFYAELGGPGILFSANYDTRFKKSPFGLGGRVGLGFVSGYFEENINSQFPRGRDLSVLTVPVQINYLFGKPSSVNALEIGAGVTYIGKKLDILNFYNDDRTQFLGTASFMYRRMPKEGGFSWRIGFTPLIAKNYIQPSGAVSVGYNF